MQKNSVLLVLLLAATTGSLAQVNHPDSLAAQLNSLSDQVTTMKKVKFSGYVQAQWQKADTAGIRFPGGNFEPNADNRFLIRRGRLKMTYASQPVTAVFQIDATDRGISLRDAYVDFAFPGALKNLSLKAGLFKRPFGFELLYSSESRESPERARSVLLLLPNERDLGAMLACKLGVMKLEAGFFNGNTVVDFDSKKDFIGRLSAGQELGGVKLGGGVSFYSGGVFQGTNKVYEFEDGKFALQDTLTALGEQAERQYLGADVQIGFDAGIGNTTLRGEFITGTQPGTASSSESPKTAILPASDTYIRSFNAGIFYFIQNLGKSNLQAVVKYDFFDPNSNAEGDGIANDGDVKYSTWGFGLNYFWKNLTFTAYYDKIENETTASIAKFNGDLDDNVLTLRIQYKF